MTTTFPLDRIARKARNVAIAKGVAAGILIGAVLMFGALATADLYGRAQAAHVIVRGDA